MQLRGILRLTFREAWAKKITLGAFLVSTFAWLMLMFALNLDVVDGSLAGIRLFGNAIETEQEVTFTDEETGETRTETVHPLGDDPLENLVIGVESAAAGITYWLGLFLALFAAAPLVVSLQERGTIDLALSKPISRSTLLTGRLLGVWLAVFLLIGYLLGMVWLIMSIKSGIWHPRFLLSIGIIVLMFMVMYGAVTLISIAARSTALALIVTYGLIFASLILGVREQLELQINLPWRHIYVALYHILPNFAEVTPMVAKLTSPDPVTSWYPLWSSCGFGLVMYGLSYLLFIRKDY